jgi:VWFA-related protein
LKELRPEGDTALLDAVAATPSQMVKGKNGKRAIVLFTDGVDNSSRLSREELEGVLEQLSIPVYPIGLVTRSVFDRGESPAAGYDVATLESLAEWSGGKMFLTEKLEDMGRVISRINREVRRQYLLGFSPSGTGAARYRSVSVSVAKSGSWRVRTRRGYHGTPPRGGD